MRSFSRERQNELFCQFLDEQPSRMCPSLQAIRSAVTWQNLITTNVVFLKILTLLSFIIVEQGNNKTIFYSFTLKLFTVRTLFLRVC